MKNFKIIQKIEIENERKKQNKRKKKMLKKKQ